MLMVVAIYVIVNDLLRATRMRDLRVRLQREKNRNRFGELRTQLVRLAIEGHLDPKSRIFKSVYAGTTTLMRNPYEFDAAASAILTIPAPPRRKRSGLKKPTRAEAEVAEEFARRLDLLCRDFSRVYTLGAWVIDRLASKDQVPPLWIQMIEERARRGQMRHLIQARKRLVETARQAC
jgi:hypothetical protein